MVLAGVGKQSGRGPCLESGLKGLGIETGGPSDARDRERWSWSSNPKNHTGAKRHDREPGKTKRKQRIKRKQKRESQKSKRRTKRRKSEETRGYSGVEAVPKTRCDSPASQTSTFGGIFQAGSPFAATRIFSQEAASAGGSEFLVASFECEGVELCPVEVFLDREIAV